jgi:hypothetical protein
MLFRPKETSIALAESANKREQDSFIDSPLVSGVMMENDFQRRGDRNCVFERAEQIAVVAEY